MTSSQDSAPLTPITSNTSVNTSLKVMDELVDEQIFTLVTKPDDQNHASYQVSQMIQKAKRSKEIIKVANDCVKVMFIASRVNRTRATHHRTPTRRSRSWTQKLTSSLKPAELQKLKANIRTLCKSIQKKVRSCRVFAYRIAEEGRVRRGEEKTPRLKKQAPVSKELSTEDLQKSVQELFEKPPQAPAPRAWR
ncbi:hypothetical protein TrVE_jg1595 [Triparma verrucosa]|uniref:Uncharacterized protein n=2 Tax=Triparma TaxID=722752 RepID=A0A9W7E0A8_9STRA|nr:hypothetical protein TrST_g12771 [Triparma strigata]GMH97586.1 hypothetical protein TrVE_jg1595 [Triparma verrucosa]